MAEHIKRDDLLQDISETVVFTVRKGTPLPNAEMRGANKVIDRIKSAPTVDVVEVVRCQNCRKLCRTTGECTVFKGCYPARDYFCNFGAKMDGVTDICVGKMDGKGE